MKKSRGLKGTAEAKYPDVLGPLLRDIAKTIQDGSKCQSVAIRLNNDGDFPYFVQIGFSDFFVEKENSLVVTDEKGTRVLDTDGMPYIECMCGNVIKGRFNPESSFFTKSGAFWTNSTTQLLSSLTDKERKEVGKTRNTCHNFGYESVALIPIHADRNTIGLVQVNDPQENRFTLEKIAKYQLLADCIGSIVLDLKKFFETVDS